MNERLKKILSDKNDLKVLVVGDIILDEYIWGSVNRISPEAPVQVVECKSQNMALGGAANVANNLTSLGCKVYIVGAVGKDEKGDRVIELLKRMNIDSEGVVRDPLRITTNKIRVIAHGQQIIRIDNEDRRPLSGEVEKRVKEYIKRITPLVDGIICSDYNKGVVTEKVFRSIVHCGQRDKKMIIVDPKGVDFSKYKGVNVITPNEKELEAASPIKIQSEEDMERAVGYLFGLIHNDAILVTRGKDGMSLFEKDGKKTHIPTEAKEVYDVTGAGDTVTGVFGMAVFKGLSFIDSARLANMAAGIVVGKVGTAVVTNEELSNFIEDGHLLSVGNILSLDELKQVISLARNREKMIVFTNGCFDIIHGGHIEFLQKAKGLGNILVVGLNDDESVKRLKGEGRPMKSQSERANILSALKYVDYITIFSEDTPERLIQEIKPDILVKGDDYSIEEVVGRDIVERYGGRVELIPIVKGMSTSGFLRKVIERYDR
ncbi:MAG: D-glycero-beta-D-manno-heptose-7-phosphate kinase [Nitrospinae bacterium]|nr:D-glycero-beta-D-manno-heptose-7-phosphate kinase [Nitrospinota bacterium]